MGQLAAFTGLIAHYKHEATQKEIVLMATYEDIHYPISQSLFDEHRRNVIEFLTGRINKHWSVLYESDAYSATGLYEDFDLDRKRFFSVMGEIQKKIAREWGNVYEPVYHIESQRPSQADAVANNLRIKECINKYLGSYPQVHRFDVDPYVLAHTIRFLADIVIPSFTDKSGKFLLELIDEEGLGQIRNLCGTIFCLMSLEIDRCYYYVQEKPLFQKIPIYNQCLEELNQLRTIALEQNMIGFMQWLNSKNGLHKAHFAVVSLFNMFALGHINSTPGNVVVVINSKRIGQLSSFLEEEGFVLQTPNLYDSPNSCMDEYLRALFPTQSLKLQSDYSFLLGDTNFLPTTLWPFDSESVVNGGLTDYQKKEYLISFMKNDSDFFYMIRFLQFFRSLPKQEAEDLLTNAFLTIDSSLVHAQICEHYQAIQRLLEICHQVRLFWMRYGEILIVDPIKFFENPLDHIKQARNVSIANIATVDQELVKSIQGLMLEALTYIEDAKDFVKVYEKVRQHQK